MKRFIMPLTAFLVVGTVLFTGCGGKEEVPQEQPPVVDTLTPPANVDTLVVDTAGTGTEVKIIDSDSAKPSATKSKKAPAKVIENVDESGNTATRRPQRTEPESKVSDTSEAKKSSDPSNTTTRRPQRP